LSPSWTDPTWQVNWNGSQPNGLKHNVQLINKLFVDSTSAHLLPPMWIPIGFTSDNSIYRPTQQLFCDGWGQNSLFWGGSNVTQAPLWLVSWEDDLIMTGVRSFDVKAYDNALANYADLGWGDDPRVYAIPNIPVPFLAGNQDFSPLWTNGNPVFPPLA